MVYPFFYIINVLFSYKFSLLLLCIQPIIKALFSIFPAFILKKLTSIFSLQNSALVMDQALYWILIYFMFICFNFIYWRIYQYIIHVKLFPNVRKDIVLDCVKSLINNSKLFFNMHPADEIAHFLIHLNENIIDIIKLITDKILYYMLSFIIIICSLLYYNFYCGCVIIGWVFFIIGITLYTLEKINNVSTKITINKSIISCFITDLFNNISLVQIFGQQKHELDLLHKKTDSLQDDEQLAGWLYFKLCCWYYISFVCMECASFYILLNQYKVGLINTSDFIFWWSVSGSALLLADAFIDDMLQLPKYYYSIKEGLSILKHNEMKTEKGTLVFKGGKIEFRNVYFSFFDKIILENISLIIQPKEKVALVGLSGSGKTTLLCLLLRLYKPNKGTIYIDDQDISTIDYESFYTIFSVIFQNHTIFDREIIDNILYGDPDKHMNQEKLSQILSFSELTEFKDIIYNNEKRNSKALSGGQQQRVAIARALYKESKILLLDEPTSSLDHITEQKIISNIHENYGDKTIILITHTLSIVESFPRILVFDKGKIIQEGSHDILIHQDGLYKKLWSLNTSH